MKLVYVSSRPWKYPRAKKLLYTLRKLNVDFNIMLPKFQREHGKNKITRFLYGTMNYMLILFQIFLVKGDVFWVANCPDILVFPLILRRRKYVLDYRSPWSIEVEEEFGKGPWTWLSEIIESVALKYAMFITLPTSKLSNRVKYLGKPVYIVPNYPTKYFKHKISREDFRRLHGVDELTKVVLLTGRLSRTEGVDLLPNIVSKVVRDANVVFWIVGDGPLRPLMERVEREHPENVRLFGWQQYEQMPNFINASDVCIVPRRRSPHSCFYNEENVQKISEYMLYKKPIIACGIAPSDQYLLVEEDEMAEGIIKAIRGEVSEPTPKTWEEHSEGNVWKVVKKISEC